MKNGKSWLALLLIACPYMPRKSLENSKYMEAL